MATGDLTLLSVWVQDRGLAEGLLAYALVNDASGEHRAVLDIAWPQGVRQELTEAVAVLIDESAELMSLANSAGFRCFTTTEAFQLAPHLGAPLRGAAQLIPNGSALAP